MNTQDLHDLKQLFELAILTGDKPPLTKSDCEMVVAAVDRVLKSEWRPVETRPADLNATYLVTDGKMVAPWIRGVIHNNPGTEWDWNWGSAITHWRPIDPPKVSV